MILESRTVNADEFARETGWELRPEGACKGETCIPLPDEAVASMDVLALAEAMGLPVVEDTNHGLIAVGPESIGARALTTAIVPDVTLPDLDGNPFSLSSLKGQKIVVYAWAPY
jgi:hypothetical protein